MLEVIFPGNINFSFHRHLLSLGQQLLRRVIAESAATSTGAAAALHYLLAELPELLLPAVATVEQGPAGYTSQPPLWPTPAAPYRAATGRQLQASPAARRQVKEQPEEVQTTLLTQLHLLRLHPASRCFLYLAVAAPATNLALARGIKRQPVGLW